MTLPYKKSPPVANPRVRVRESWRHMHPVTQSWFEIPRYRDLAMRMNDAPRFAGYLLVLGAVSGLFLWEPVAAFTGLSFAAFIEIAAAQVALTAAKVVLGYRSRLLPPLDPLFWAWVACRPGAAAGAWIFYQISSWIDGLLVRPSLWHGALLLALPPAAVGVAEAVAWPHVSATAALLTAATAALTYGWLAWSMQRFADLLDESNRRAAEKIRKDERERIAGDLHDGLGAIFTGMTLRCRVAAAATPAEARRLVDELIAMSDKALRKIRLLARSFSTEELTGDELEGLVRGLLTEAAPQLTAFHLEGLPPANLDREFVYHLLHLIGEATVNAVRHGQAGFISVRLFWNGGLWLLRIEDNGRGMTQAERDQLQHASALATRTRRMGVRMTVSGAAQAGTRLEFSNSSAEVV